MKHTYPLAILVCTLLFLLTTSAFAQTNKTQFSGTVTDANQQPIPGATVMVLDAADSTLVQFASTDAQGKFVVKQVAKGAYVLNINFLGMAPYYQSIEAGLEETKDLGFIVMQEENTILREVQVKADHVPIEITKDTISYNADAFETQPNAVVEDLLKKLPGIEVGPDGTIKAQGEEVQNVLVDGKEFFGDDPKMATKNLPANALKKVKVYDKKSDTAEFTGVDDGSREKTIDLQLKDEFKKGLFGTAQAGYGSDSRYNARASVNRFTKTTQLSFLGQFNNVNDQGFSFSDRMNFSGGMRGMGGGGRGGMQMNFSSSDIPWNDGSGNGLTTTGAGGLNFNIQTSKKFNVRSSYFYNNVEKNLLQDLFRQTLFPVAFDTEQNKSEETENQSHSFSLNSDVQLDSFSQLQLSSRLNFGDASGTSASVLENFTNNTLENRSVSVEDNVNDNFYLNGNATYTRKFGTRGRNFSLNGGYTANNSDGDNFLSALNEYFITGNEEQFIQSQLTASDNTRWEGSIFYTEPLRKRRFLNLSYNYSRSEDIYDYTVSDITENGAIENPDFSTEYVSVFQYQRPGATFRYSGEVHNLNIGVEYQLSELDGIIEQSENTISKDYQHFLPRLLWRWDIGNGKNAHFRYTTRVNQPSITQLSPAIDNSDPLRLYIGNPDLNAEYSHNVNLNFNSFSQFSSTNFFISLSGSLTEDRIVTSRTIDEQFVETTSPVNIDEEKRISLFTSFGRPLKPIHSRVNLNLNFSVTNTQNYINNALLDLNQWSRSVGLTISNMNSEVLQYNLGGNWTFTDKYYQANDALNQNTLLSNYFSDVTLTLWKKWEISGQYNINVYTSDEFAETQTLPLLGFSISRFILPNDKGQIKLSVFDALNKNRGLSRSADINYLQEIRANSISRYAMLSFIYAIRGREAEGRGAGGFRVTTIRG